MEMELEKSYIELLDRIKAEVRNNNQLLPSIITHFLPAVSGTDNNSLKKKFKKLLSFSEKNKINSVDDLIRELESNRVVTSTNVSALEFIVNKLDNNILKLFFHRHNELIVKCQHGANQEDPQKLNSLGEEVRELVCQGISKRWVDLGRQLRIPDETLDQIEHKHDEFWRRASKVLDHFENNTPVEERGALLVKGLIAAKRKDLADKIQPLLDQSKSLDNKVQ